MEADESSYHVADLPEKDHRTSKIIATETLQPGKTRDNSYSSQSSRRKKCRRFLWIFFLVSDKGMSNIGLSASCDV
jgi:hypothetical protein